MSTVFSVIIDDFHQALLPLKDIVQDGQAKKSSMLARVASVNAATLLLAATFEEFIRQMARQFAIEVVASAGKIDDVPYALLETAWRRTLHVLTQSNKSDGVSKKEALRFAAKRARPTIDALCSFIEGDIGQDIFENLIHNENNMGSEEINQLFKVGGVSNICIETCKSGALKAFFEADDDVATHTALLSALKGFFKRRNQIAHSLNSKNSSSPNEILRDICIFVAFSSDLGRTLEMKIAERRAVRPEWSGAE
ncbi:MAG: hypothetical protein INF79_03080 [Roseomonas sp.]|nr:hypothetical protein [Roseomonas sp.]